MTISSRTPEGFPSKCPICGASLRLGFSNPGNDAPCPNCGCLVWYSIQLWSDFRKAFGKKLGISFEAIELSTPLNTLDSLDLVELIMEFEEEFGLDVTMHEDDKLQTIGDLIRIMARRKPKQ